MAARNPPNWGSSGGFCSPTRKGSKTSVPTIQGERHSNSKLTETKVADILVMRHLRGIYGRKIAKEFGVSHNTIEVLCYGRTWKHLTHGHRDVIVFPEGEPVEAFNARLDEIFDYLKNRAHLGRAVRRAQVLSLSTTIT
jgi:hypothetical protein